MKTYGIDVSHHQGVIDWAAVASELRRVNGGATGFAILRAGYSNRSGKGGLVLDGQILKNLDGCTKHGIPCGVYVYCYDQSAAAAATTMAQCLQLIKDYQIDYPVVYDIEYEPFYTTAGKAVNTEIVKAAMQTVEAAKYYGMIYASRDFFQRFTDLPKLGAFDKWEAAYTATDSNAVPDNGLWQFSSSNPLGIAGFGNSLDCDVAYKDYPAIIKAAGLNGYGKTEQMHKRLLSCPMSEGDRRTIDDLIFPTFYRLGLTYEWVSE